MADGAEAQMHRQIRNALHRGKVAQRTVAPDAPGAEFVPQRAGAGHAGADAELEQVAAGEADFGQWRHAGASSGEVAAADAGGAVGCGQPLQPGIPVRGEYREGPAGLRLHLVSGEDHLILPGMEGDAALPQGGGDPVVARLGRRLVVAVGMHGGDPEFARERRNFVLRPAVAHDQATAAPAQRRVEFDQRVADEMHAAVAPRRQRVEYGPVEDEGAVHLAAARQRGGERGMIVVAQVAAEPDEGFFFVHGWFVPRRRLEFQQ